MARAKRVSIAVQVRTDRITREGEQWCVVSEDGDTKLGCYDSEEGANERLREVEAAKSASADATNSADSADVKRSDAGERVQRFDLGGRVSKLTKTPTGGVRVDARITRTGVLTYERGDGTSVRELRRPEEVFHADSLATLEDAAVTVGHPGDGSRLVSPDTFRSDAVGHVRGPGRIDGDYVASELAIGDADAIRRIDAGELIEISAGYSARIDAISGVWNGERYDQEQREIRYNHAALLPRGAGRAGAGASLRLDARAAVTRADCGCGANRSDAALRVIRGDLFDNGENMPEEEKKPGDELAAAVTRAETAEAQRDVALARIAELEAKLAEESEPERMDARVAERVAFLTKSRSILGADERLDGKSEVEIMHLALAKAAPALELKDRSAEYIRARFDAEAERASVSPLEQARRAAFAPITPASARIDARDLHPNLADKWRR